ncbi:MAG: FAD-dependent thymidylate synthase [Planctomycetota bacterium]
MSDLHANPEYPTELETIKILDYGFVSLIDVMGEDSSIVQAARVSYGKGTKTVRNDKALISYLMRHAHTTPFEMIEFKFLMRIPLFIARQVIRHRTANVNEYSGRYSEVPDRFWAPRLGAIAEQDTVNRQGRADQLRELVESLPERTLPAVACAFVPGETALLVADNGTGISRAGLLNSDHRLAFTPAWSEGAEGGDMLPSQNYLYWTEQLLHYFPERKRRLEQIRQVYQEQNEQSYARYRQLLEQGVAREIARCVLPLSMYTEWYWKVDLHNLFHFLRLRMDPHAQLEVRELAEAMAAFVKPRVPFAWQAFEEDRVKGTFLSVHEREVLAPTAEDDQRNVLIGLYERGYRSRRLKEVCRKFNIDERMVDELWPPSDQNA